MGQEHVFPLRVIAGVVVVQLMQLFAAPVQVAHSGEQA